MPSSQVVTWAKGWHAIDLLKGRHEDLCCCTFVCAIYIRRPLERIGSSLASRLGLSARLHTVIGSVVVNLYNGDLFKQPSSLYPHPSLQDHVSREGHRFPQVGKSLP